MHTEAIGLDWSARDTPAVLGRQSQCHRGCVGGGGLDHLRLVCTHTSNHIVSESLRLSRITISSMMRERERGMYRDTLATI